MQYYDCFKNTRQSKATEWECGIIKVRIKIVRTMWITRYEERIWDYRETARWRWWLQTKETVDVRQQSTCTRCIHAICFQFNIVVVAAALSPSFILQLPSSKHCWLSKDSSSRNEQNGIVKMRQNESLKSAITGLFIHLTRTLCDLMVFSVFPFHLSPPHSSPFLSINVSVFRLPNSVYFMIHDG